MLLFDEAEKRPRREVWVTFCLRDVSFYRSRNRLHYGVLSQ